MSDFAVDMQLKPNVQRCPCDVQNVILLLVLFQFKCCVHKVQDS